MDSRIATAAVRFRLDVNFGDPVPPAPEMIELPSLRPATAPVRVLGYPMETVLAEKLATAIMLGAANTRVRDYADLHVDGTPRPHARRGRRCAGRDRTVPWRGDRAAVIGHRRSCEPRERTYRAYRTALGVDGAELPADFGEIVDAVTTFADQLARTTDELHWRAAVRRWIAWT